jgi:hypothetical protein
MATATERYKIALNILARVGIDGNLHDEYARAMSTLHGLQTYNEMNVPQTPQDIISPPMGNNATQDPNTVNQPQNEGNGTLNLPQM